MRVVISSGHGKHIRGASGYLDEVDEARRVVERTADVLRNFDIDVVTFHDDISTSQDENLHRIVDFHNAQARDLDISVHFNAYEPTDKPMGTEVLYVTQDELADEMSIGISAAGGLLNRGAKYRDDLYFLNNTEQPSILIEVCFVDSSVDAQLYTNNFDLICEEIAETLSDRDQGTVPPPLPPEAFTPPFVVFQGKCSAFGGPNDMGVTADEGLAFHYSTEDGPHLFLPWQPAETTGLARRLDPDVFYVACRWDYNTTPKEMLADPMLKAYVTAPKTGRSYIAWPADWGPHDDTDRIADLSPGLMNALGITTDDEVRVIYPTRNPADVSTK